MLELKEDVGAESKKFAILDIFDVDGRLLLYQMATLSINPCDAPKSIALSKNLLIFGAIR